METNRDRVWDPMQQVVPLEWIPIVSYTSKQTYKNILVKKKCSSQMETKENKKIMASKIMDYK